MQRKMSASASRHRPRRAGCGSALFFMLVFSSPGRAEPKLPSPPPLSRQDPTDLILSSDTEAEAQFFGGTTTRGVDQRTVGTATDVAKTGGASVGIARAMSPSHFGSLTLTQLESSSRLSSASLTLADSPHLRHLLSFAPDYAFKIMDRAAIGFGTGARWLDMDGTGDSERVTYWRSEAAIAVKGDGWQASISDESLHLAARHKSATSIVPGVARAAKLGASWTPKAGRVYQLLATNREGTMAEVPRTGARPSVRILWREAATPAVLATTPSLAADATLPTDHGGHGWTTDTGLIWQGRSAAANSSNAEPQRLGAEAALSFKSLEGRTWRLAGTYLYGRQAMNANDAGIVGARASQSFDVVSRAMNLALALAQPF